MDFFSPYSNFGGYGNDDYGYYSRQQPRRQSRQQQMLRRQEAQRQAEAREIARREAEARAYHKQRQQVYRQQQREAEAQRQAEARAYYDQLARQQQQQQQVRRQKPRQQYADPFGGFFGSSIPFHNFDETDDEYTIPTKDVAMTSPTVSESNTDEESDSDNDVFYDSLESAEPSDEEESESESEPELPAPTVVVYSTPQPAVEKNVTKRLQKMGPVIERHVDTFERIKKAISGGASSDSSDDYESLLSSTKSRLKVIQNAQMKLEQLYDQLDSIKTDNKKDKALRTTLIKKSVGTAEAIDSVVQTLKEQRNYYKQCIEEEDTTSSESDTSSSDIVYHVTLEEVPDSDFSELSE